MNAINKIAARFILSVVVVTFTATASLSAPITVPAGLNPGDQYRLAFVTSTERDATSSNIADYNAFVSAAANSQAALAALGTTWMAIASTSSVDARDNTGTNPISTGFPIFLLDPASTKIADNNADLWDINLDAPLNVDESGTFLPETAVWTGSGSSGLGSDVLGGFDNPIYGITSSNNSRWVNDGGFPVEDRAALYAISGILTVAEVVTVSEPGALGVLALGIVGLGIVRRKRLI